MLIRLIYFTVELRTDISRCTSRGLLVTLPLMMGLLVLTTGLVFLFENTMVVVVLSTVIRVLQGVVGFCASVVYVDFVSGNFPDRFDAVNGLLNMGMFCGHGIAEAVGSCLYDRFGYVAPFLFAAGMELFAAVLVMVVCTSNSRTHYASQPKDLEEASCCTSTKLSKLLILPMLAIMLVNANYGYLQVSYTHQYEVHFNRYRPVKSSLLSA